MKKTSKTIVFFGSGPVAAKSLELLLDTFAIEAVITKPKPAHHRGEFPVLDVTQKHDLKTHTPASKKELTELFKETSFSSAVGLVIDYGIIIEADVIDTFPLGIANSHFSLLPQWRGADPITFAILSGQQQTGISVMRINERMDEGPLLAQATYDISPKLTAPELTKDLIELSDATLKEILPLYLDGAIETVPQEIGSVLDTVVVSYSRKIQKSDGVIDWQKPAEVLEREIRAYIEWPKSHAQIADKDVVLLEAEVVRAIDEKPGAARVIDGSLIVACGRDALKICRLKPSGKKEMTAQAFLAGHKIQ